MNNKSIVTERCLGEIEKSKTEQPTNVGHSQEQACGSRDDRNGEEGGEKAREERPAEDTSAGVESISLASEELSIRARETHCVLNTEDKDQQENLKSPRGKQFTYKGTQ